MKIRTAVKLLSVLLTMHPVLKDILRIGMFVGTSDNQARASNLGDLINISDPVRNIERPTKLDEEFDHCNERL